MIKRGDIKPGVTPPEKPGDVASVKRLENHITKRASDRVRSKARIKPTR